MIIFLIFIFMAFLVCLGLLFTYGRDPMQGDEGYEEEHHRTTWEDNV